MTAISVRIPDANAQREAILRNGVFVAALSATPAQIDAWLNANVTNLAQARVVLSMLMQGVAYLVNIQNPEADGPL